MPTATFLPGKPSLASRLARTSYSRQDCLAALRGTAVPQSLGNNVVRLALVAGIRKNVALARLPELQELCDHDAEQMVFARARNARLIMSNQVPEEDMIRDEQARPYCIWHPDVATEQAYRALVDWYPEMKYQAARACAVAGYADLYRELDVLPDISVAEEARGNTKSPGAQKIYESIMATPTRYNVMDDYTLTISASPRPGAQLNADTALVSSLKETERHSTDFEPHWRPFNITEDWGIAEQTFSRKPVTLTSKETSLLDSPLPFDLPTPNKNLLIRRPTPARSTATLACVAPGPSPASGAASSGGSTTASFSRPGSPARRTTTSSPPSATTPEASRPSGAPSTRAAS